MTLILVAILAGLIAGISPCIVPVLPVVLVAGATADNGRSPWRRSISIAIGLVVSFSVIVLASTELLSLLHLPQDFLIWAGRIILGLVGLGFIVPQIGEFFERLFVRLAPQRQPVASASGLLIGFALGFVFVPCAGPVLAAITVLGERNHVNLYTVFVTLAFSIGAVIPLLFVALFGGTVVERTKILKQHAKQLRIGGGALMIVMAILLSFSSITNFFESHVPGYTTALQNKIEGNSTVRQDLQNLKGTKSTDGKLADCEAGDPVLQECGKAPNFTDITAWFNTPGNKPLSISGLKGKVVLVDFWTYSCINCQRTLPHVEAWYNRYKADGLVVVGVSAPEFAFEHVVSNVKAASKQLGVDYPVAIDDHLGTWTAYNNEYWPADYLIDANGIVRHVEYGEGDYSLSESLIRKLLKKAHPGIKLPPRTNVANLTPTEPTNPESYVGYERLQYNANVPFPATDKTETFTFPSQLTTGYFAFSGQWDDHEQEATAIHNAALELSYQAKDVYLVMGGTGTVKVSAGDGTAPKTIHVGGVPRLYTLFHAKDLSTGTLHFTATPGIKAYDFTFG